MATNIYPAKVTVGDVVHAKARVRTDRLEQRIQVWVLAKQYPHMPVCIVDSPIDATLVPFNNWAPIKQRHGQWRLGNGTIVEAHGLPGCGCGDKLKALPQWQPQTQEVVTV